MFQLVILFELDVEVGDSSLIYSWIISIIVTSLVSIDYKVVVCL